MLGIKKSTARLYLEVRSLLPGMACHCGSVESYCFPDNAVNLEGSYVKEKEKSKLLKKHSIQLRCKKQPYIYLNHFEIYLVTISTHSFHLHLIISKIKYE